MQQLLEDKIDVLEGLPLMVCLLQASNQKVVYFNSVAKDSLGKNLEGNTFNNFFENSTELKRVLNKTFNDEETMKVFVQSKYHTRYMLYIKKYHIDIGYNDTILMVTGINITTIKKEHYFDFTIDKNAALNIYSKVACLSFLEECLYVVKNEDSYFSVAYISTREIEDLLNSYSNLEKEAHLKELASIINNRIRGTDMFASINDLDFLLVFPKCKHEVMLNILISIENRLELINNSNERNIKFKINYAVLEVSRKNMGPVEDIIKRAKELVVYA